MLNRTVSMICFFFSSGYLKAFFYSEMLKRFLKTNICLFLFVLVSCKKEDEFICPEWENVCYDFTVEIDSVKINRKVLIIGIDGFRADAMRDNISPFLFELAHRSTTYYTDKNLIEDLTFSGPNWSSLLTGVHRCKHEVTTNDYSNNMLEVFPTFYRYVEDADSNINTASITSWIPINSNSTADFADYALLDKISDEEVYQFGRDILLNQNPLAADVLFLYFEDPDNTGHTFGFHPNISEYANSLRTIDGYIDDLFSIIEDKRALGEDWIVFVVSDHGGEGTGHSGGFDNDNIKYTIFFANHPTESFNHAYTSTQVDLAPTVLDFLGISSSEFDCKTDGVSLLQ